MSLKCPTVSGLSLKETHRGTQTIISLKKLCFSKEGNPEQMHKNVTCMHSEMRETHAYLWKRVVMGTKQFQATSNNCGALAVGNLARFTANAFTDQDSSREPERNMQFPRIDTASFNR